MSFSAVLCCTAVLLLYCCIAGGRTWWVLGLLVDGLRGWYLPAQPGGWMGGVGLVHGLWVGECEFNTKPAGVPVCPLALQAYH